MDEYPGALQHMQTNMTRKKNFLLFLIFVNCLKLHTYVMCGLSGVKSAETLPVSRNHLHCIYTISALYPIIMQGFSGGKIFVGQEYKRTLGVNRGWGLY